MICNACSMQNDSQAGNCRACGNALRAQPSVAGHQVATIDDPYEARIAAVESRLATLALHLAAVEAERAEIAASLARAGVLLPTKLGPTTEREGALPLGERQTLDVGRFRVTFGGPHGTTVEATSVRRADVPAAPAVVHGNGRTGGQIRSATQSAVWSAFAAGAQAVRIVGEPGSGVSAFLETLALNARAHGFTDGVLALAGVRGPADDVAQRLATLRRPVSPARYYLAGELRQIFSDSRHLAVIDRTDLTAADQTRLFELFPKVRFVIADSFAVSTATTIALGPLDGADAASVLAAGYGSAVEGAELDAALALCATVGLLPGPIRLIGVAAKQWCRSFVSLAAQYAQGSEIVAALIATCSPIEQRILAVMTLAPGSLSADGIAAVVGSAEVSESLDRLRDCALVQVSAGIYLLPRYVAPFASSVRDFDAVLERIVEALCAQFDRTATPPGSASGIAAAEPILQTAFERSRWPQVLALGPQLAQRLAREGAFDAWGRVLNLVAAAAKRIDDAALLGLARHELGVRALLLGEHHKATTMLRSAMQERERAGDSAAADASRKVFVLAEEILGEPDVVPRASTRSDVVRRSGGTPQRPTRSGLTPPRKPAFRMTTRRLLAFSLSVAVLVLVGVWLATRPKAAPQIVDFSSNHGSIAAGATAQLCLTVSHASLVRVTPDVGPLSAQGKQCVDVKPATTTTYTAIASGVDDQEARSTATVSVHDATAGRPLAIAAFFFHPATVRAGQSTQLCYAVTGADMLRIVPSVGKLERLKSCRTVTPDQRRHSRYQLVAIGENGQVATRRTDVDVVPSAVPAATALPTAAASRSAAASPTAPPSPGLTAVGPLATAVPLARKIQPNTPDGRLARRAVYQFDVTPGVVERGQAASLCAGIGRWATGSVSGIGPLEPGITRCYRVHPYVTTAYRLRVALDASAAVETVTVAVRNPSRPHQVAHDEHR